MYSVADCGAELVGCEALVDTVVLSGWLVVCKNQRSSTDHLLNTESIHHQRFIVLRPLIPGPHTLLLTYLLN